MFILNDLLEELSPLASAFTKKGGVGVNKRPESLRLRAFTIS